MLKSIQKLVLLMGGAGLNGTVPMAALNGLFRPENAATLALAFMIGPGSIITAALLEGPAHERMIAALLAGIIATSIIMLSAGIGPQLLDLLNLRVLQIVGGIGIMTIGLLVMGVKVPDKLPVAIMILGLVLSAMLN